MAQMCGLWPPVEFPNKKVSFILHIQKWVYYHFDIDRVLSMTTMTQKAYSDTIERFTAAKIVAHLYKGSTHINANVSVAHPISNWPHPIICGSSHREYGARIGKQFYVQLYAGGKPSLQ